MVQDGRCIIEISSDAMIAKATFVPPVGEGRPMTLDEAEMELRANGVCEGLLVDQIRNKLEECTTHKQIIRDVIVAQGKRDRAEIPECWVFHPKIQALDPLFLPPEKAGQVNPATPPTPTTQAEKADVSGNIDYRETHGLFIIHEGQLLALKRPAIQGIPGTNVKGEFIPFKKISVASPEPGDNTDIKDDRAYASKNGRFAWNTHNFWVEETLELKQDVGYETGNIRFPGSLILKGGIRDRFKVWVGLDLDASGVVDAYEIYCGRNMNAPGGLIGRGKGLVRIRGNLQTRFVEHCDVEALGAITLEHGSLSSHVYTLGSVKTGEKGRIVGGRVQARDGIDVFQLGNSTGVHTTVSIGENYVMHRKLDYAREKFQVLNMALQRVQERVAKHPEDSLLRQAERLAAEAARYQSLMVDTLSEINDREDAELIVHGSIFPGVQVEICRVPLLITKEMKAVRFSLNKENGKVSMESLAKPK